jgi:long-subunit acyl-CoA synthetase (AMP-forming)
MLAAASADEPFVEVDESKPTVIYTSGTTSQPKGVALTYLNLSVYVTNTMSPADPEHRTRCHAPLRTDVSRRWGDAHHVFVWGRTLVILPVRPEAVVEAVQNEHVTHISVPTMLKRIMEHPTFTHTT